MYNAFYETTRNSYNGLAETFRWVDDKGIYTFTIEPPPHSGIFRSKKKEDTE